MSTTYELKPLLLAERLDGATAVATGLPALMRLPTVVMWNRIEGRPKSADLTRALRAEIRDPLWMLSRQWQFGEFAGEDAGMPVRAKLAANTTRLTSVALRDQSPVAYDPQVPLEAVVERQPFEPDFMAGLHIGQRWLGELERAFGAEGAALAADFGRAYPIVAPVAGGRDLAALHLVTHRAEAALRLALAGRGIDGALLFADLAALSPSAAFAARGVAVTAEQAGMLDGLASSLVTALGISTPPDVAADAWDPRRLGHVFTLGAAAADGTETRLVADQYPGGRLDWHALDIAAPGPAGPGDPQAERRIASFVPTAIRFKGAPNMRWWEFEDRDVGFGLTTAAKTDIVKLLLAQFALVYSNDWFIVPFAAPVGTLIEVDGIVVTDNFGINSLIEPTGRRGTELGLAGRWGMWTLDRRDVPGTVDTRFFLAPALARSQESPPMEELLFLRDEMANLVWGVETIIPDPLGGGRDARAAGKLLRDAVAIAYPEVVAGRIGDGVLLEYRLMGQVPENWIPFVSVRLQDEPTATRFLQGAMPRVPALTALAGALPATALAHDVVLPRGSLLARDPVGEPNLINEEELLRTGTLLRRSYQQTRTPAGARITWQGRHRLNGRGEGSSGLAFDQALRKPVADA